VDQRERVQQLDGGSRDGHRRVVAGPGRAVPPVDEGRPDPLAAGVQQFADGDRERPGVGVEPAKLLLPLGDERGRDAVDLAGDRLQRIGDELQRLGQEKARCSGVFARCTELFGADPAGRPKLSSRTTRGPRPGLMPAPRSRGAAQPRSSSPLPMVS
jgi:hypothetical protein